MRVVLNGDTICVNEKSENSLTVILPKNEKYKSYKLEKIKPRSIQNDLTFRK